MGFSFADTDYKPSSVLDEPSFPSSVGLENRVVGSRVPNTKSRLENDAEPPVLRLEIVVFEYDNASGRLLGEQFDPDLGMYFLRARYLDTDRGRFWSMDTFEGNNQDPRSLHKYLYVGHDPINFADPSGNIRLSTVVATAAIIGTLSFIATPSVEIVGPFIFTGEGLLICQGFGGPVGGGSICLITVDLTLQREVSGRTCGVRAMGIFLTAELVSASFGFGVTIAAGAFEFQVPTLRTVDECAEKFFGLAFFKSAGAALAAGAGSTQVKFGQATGRSDGLETGIDLTVFSFGLNRIQLGRENFLETMTL